MRVLMKSPLLKTSALAVSGLLGLALAANAVSATLQAEAKNITAHAITSGTLKITQAKNGVGFDSTIADMAPGDTVNRYVDYSNSGTLASKALRLKVSDGTPTILSTDATKGLQLVVTDCSTAWNPTAGTCSGTSTTLLTSALSNVATDTNFANITTLAANGGALHLQFALTLPNGTNNETVTNGTLPTTTIQGLTAALTWTLSETQRDGSTTNA